MKISDVLRLDVKLPQSDSARLDVELLLAHCMKCERSYFYTWPEHEVDAAVLLEFDALLQRRILGEPVAHLLGHREFWDIDLQVDNSTLIPRPETELLIELALEKFPVEPSQVLDLGTGSGAIALTLAGEWPACSISACDYSVAATALAEKNRLRLNAENVEVFRSDWFESIKPNQLFDLIISNPPYIDPSDHHLQEGDVRFEPLSALVSADKGLADLRHIIKNAQNFLRPKGWVMLEHGYNQGRDVRSLLVDEGFKLVSTEQDLAGVDRVSLGCKHE